MVLRLSDCVPVFNSVARVQVEFTQEDVFVLSTEFCLVVLKSADF